MSGENTAVVKRKISFLFTAGLFVFTFVFLFGCENPWMKDILGDEKKETAGIAQT